MNIFILLIPCKCYAYGAFEVVYHKRKNLLIQVQLLEMNFCHDAGGVPGMLKMICVSPNESC